MLQHQGAVQEGASQLTQTLSSAACWGECGKGVYTNYRRFTCSWRSVCISHSTILPAHEVVYLQKLRSWATQGSTLPPLPWWKWWRSYLCWPKRLIQDAWNSHVCNVVSSGYPQSFQSNQVSMREGPPTSCLAIVPQFKSAGTPVREWPISCQSFQPWTL